MPVVAVAVLLGVALLGVSSYSLATRPGRASRPQNPQGTHATQTPQGSESSHGIVGLAHTTVIRAAPMVSAPHPQVGTVLTAKTMCPAGSVLLSGGAKVTASGTGARRNVALSESLPLSDTTWQTMAIVTGPLGHAGRMTLTPFVICEVPAATSAATTETSLS
jgi:hypothetical protein